MQKSINWAISLYIFLSLMGVLLTSNAFNESSNITYDSTALCFFIPILISLLSYISTWRKLNKYYSTKLEPLNRVQLLGSGRIGFISYRNCLTIGVLDNGIYLSNLLGALAIFNKPLLITWSDITDVSISRTTYKIKIQNASFSTKISLPINSLKDAEDLLKTKIKS